MHDNAFHVKTEVFEGPIDLLLSLIEKRKFFINDISLAKVADDFLDYIKNIPSLPVGDTAQFLLIASTLVLVKSKSLLPTLTLTDDEKGDIEDLEARLRIYKKMREISDTYVKVAFGRNIIYLGSPPKKEKVVFSPSKDLVLSAVSSAMASALRSLPKKNVAVTEVAIRKVMSLDEMMDNLASRMSKSLKMSFGEFSKMNKADKVHIAVSFLAMLELVKQGMLDVKQSKNFADIDMQSHDVSTPQYN